MPVVTAIIALALALAACHPVSREEAQVIGTWQWKNYDGFARISFRRDHRVEMCFPETEDGPCDPKSTKRYGTWHIRGNDVVYSVEFRRFEDEAITRVEDALPLKWFPNGATPPDGPYFRRAK